MDINIDTNIVEEKITLKDIILGFIDIFRSKGNDDAYKDSLDKKIQQICASEDRKSIEALEEMMSQVQTKTTGKHIIRTKIVKQQIEARKNTSERTIEDNNKDSYEK